MRRGSEERPVTKTTKIDTLIYAGHSGQQYELRVYVWETRFKAIPGVYVIASRAVEPDAEPIYRPVYVGTAEDLSKVFVRHPQGDCFQLHYANTIAVLREADGGARERIAQDLIASLQPPCNSTDAD
jgi:hypothetical protein